MIDLPYGARFDPHDLATHIRQSGRCYIIQGQQKATMADHTKPQSLDFWLRRFAPNPDTKQAENSVVDALVATGLFRIAYDLICPDKHTRCKGVYLVDCD